ACDCARGRLSPRQRCQTPAAGVRHRWPWCLTPVTGVSDTGPIAVAIFAPMLVEALRAARNERLQRARGGIEPPDDVYTQMQIAYPGAFVAMLLELAWRSRPPVEVLTAGAVVFAFAKALKWWAILTLGSAWTFRVIVVPGTPLVARGPYRLFRHPNYIAVL